MNIITYTVLFLFTINKAFPTSPDSQTSTPASAAPETAPQAAEPQNSIPGTGLPKWIRERRKKTHYNHLKALEQQATQQADEKAAEAKELESLVKGLEDQAGMLRKKEGACRETAAALAKKLSSIDKKNSLTR